MWDRVEPLAANECGGSKNSPTAVDDMACTDYHNYVMVVTSKRSTFEYKRVWTLNNSILKCLYKEKFSLKGFVHEKV